MSGSGSPETEATNSGVMLCRLLSNRLIRRWSRGVTVVELIRTSNLRSLLNEGSCVAKWSTSSVSVLYTWGSFDGTRGRDENGGGRSGVNSNHRLWYASSRLGVRVGNVPTWWY